MKKLIKYLKLKENYVVLNNETVVQSVIIIQLVLYIDNI